jgi:hypothetical protein
MEFSFSLNGIRKGPVSTRTVTAELTAHMPQKFLARVSAFLEKPRSDTDTATNPGHSSQNVVTHFQIVTYATSRQAISRAMTEVSEFLQDFHPIPGG